jgi:hypothetical protein
MNSETAVETKPIATNPARKHVGKKHGSHKPVPISNKTQQKPSMANNFEPKKAQQKKDLKPVETIGNDKMKNLIAFYSMKPDERNKEKENQNSQNQGLMGNIKNKMNELLEKGKQKDYAGSNDPILLQRRSMEVEGEGEEEGEEDDMNLEDDDDLRMSDEEADKEENLEQEEADQEVDKLENDQQDDKEVMKLEKEDKEEEEHKKEEDVHEIAEKDLEI